jgi:hypothetical protein
MPLRTAVKRLTDETKIVTPAYRKGQRDRTKSFSGSSAGACLRAQEFGFLGVSPDVDQLPDTDLISIFDDGRWRHLRWQANLLSAGILKGIEVPLDWPLKRSKGSMDGWGVVWDDHPHKQWRGKDFGFELKGVNGFQFSKLVQKKMPKDEHVHQTMRYFAVSGVDLFVVLYECKLTQRTHEWVLEPDEDMIADTIDELNDLNAAVDRQQVHPQLRSCSARMGPFWEGCPYAGKGGICETWRDQGKVWV